MKKLFKKIIVLVIVLVVARIAFGLFFGTKTAEIGDKINFINEGEVVVHDISLKKRSDLIFTNLSNLKFALDDDEGAVLVYYTYENIGKSDRGIYADDITVDYNDGVRYEGELLYLKTPSGDYKLFENGVLLEKVTSDPTDFMTVVPVPVEVLEDDAPLIVKMYNVKFKVR